MIYTILCFIQVFGSYFFIGPQNHYSVLLPNEIELVQIDTLGNDLINHTFYKMTDDIEFSLSFSVTNSPKKDLQHQNTIKDYEVDCNCKVEEVIKVEYASVKGVKYIIEKQINEVQLGGEVFISEIERGSSINIVCLTTQDMASQLSSHLDPILNSLVLNL